jgi:hypothetical protein
MRPNPEWPRTGFELVGLFILGCLLSICVIKRSNLYLAIGLHAVLAYWARVNKLFFKVDDQFAQWLIGTNRLVDGVLAWVVFAVILCIIVTRSSKKIGGEDGKSL